MLEAIPRHWFSWNYRLTEEQRPVAEIDISWWREKGVLTIGPAQYRVYRERIMGGAFLIERDGVEVARAEKPSAMRRRLEIEHVGRRYTLRPRHVGSRRFELVGDRGLVGTLSPRHFLSRKMRVELSPILPLPVRVFVVWLTILLWKRDRDAAAAGS